MFAFRAISPDGTDRQGLAVAGQRPLTWTA